VFRRWKKHVSIRFNFDFIFKEIMFVFDATYEALGIGNTSIIVP
jgi:hypothetical protein